jgi:hypothetical protein
MAGEGLIWAGIGQGIANAGSTMGSFLMRSQERDAEREYRERQAQETRDFRAEQNALYRRPADEQAAGRAGKDQGLQLEDTAPGGKAANMMANKMGMSEAEYEQFYKANKTGDLSRYAKPIGTTLDDTYGEQTVTEVPQALKEEFALKRKTLGELQESYVLKKDYDAVMKGRDIGFKTNMGQAAFDKPDVASRAGQAVAVADGKPLYDVKDGTQVNLYSGKNEATAVGSSVIGENVAKAGLINFKTGVGQGVLAGTTKMGTGSGAVAASEGKPIINVEGGELYNQYSGDSKTTPLGKSQIAENQAQAGQAGALAKKYGKDIEKIDAEIAGGMFNKNSSERLSTVINAANATIKSLQEGSKGSTKEAQAAWQRSMDDAVAVRDQAQALQRGALEAKNTPPAPAVRNPGPTNPAAKRPVFNQKTGLLEYR